MFCMRIQLRKDRDLVRQLDKLTELINKSQLDLFRRAKGLAGNPCHGTRLGPLHCPHHINLWGVDGHVKLSQKWSFKTEPLGN